MKLPRLFFIIAALISSAIAQTAGVTKSVAPATLNQITGDLVFPAGKTLTVNGTVSGTPAGGTLDLSAVTLTPPSNVVTLTGSQTLTNKTLTSPTLTTPNIGAATGTSVNLSGTGTFGGNLTVSGKIIGGNSSDSGAISTLRSSGAATGLANVKASSALTVVDNTTANTDSAMVFGVNGSGAYIQGLYTTVASTITLQPYGGSTTLGGNLTVSGNGLNTFGGTGATNASILFGANNVANASAGYLSISQRLNYGFALFGYNMTGTSGSDAYTSPKNATGSAGVELIGGSLGITRFIYSTAATTAGNALTVTEAARFSNGNLLLKSDGIDSGNGKLQLATHSTSAGGIGFGTDISLYRNGSGGLLATTAGTLTGGVGAGYFSITTSGASPLVLGTNGVEGFRLDGSNQNATFAGSVTASGNISSNAVFGSSSGTLYLRPNGISVASGQATVDSSGNATFANTIIQTQAAAGSTANLKLGELGIREWGFYATGGKMSIRPSSIGTWSFNGNTDVELLRTTASTSTTTGALVVSGGVGVAGAVNAGGNVTAADVLLGGTSGPSTLSSLSSRAPHGGIAFDGTSGARISSTLTNQNLGTDSFSVSMTIEVPTANPSTSRGLWYLSSSNTTNNVANAAFAELKTAGELVVYITGAASSDVRTVTVSGFRASYSGKRVVLTFVRDSSASTMTVYANGVALSGTGGTTGTPPAWSGSVTSTYFVLGNNASGGEVWDRAIYSASLYNLALSASDVVEIYENSGAVPFRYQFGSQVATYSTSGTASSTNNLNFGLTALANRTYRVRMVISGGSTGADNLKRVFFYNPNQNTPVSNVADPGFSGDGAKDVLLIATTSGVGLAYNTYHPSAVWSGNYAVTVAQVGAIVHLTLDDGVGYQLHDASTNKLDAVMTTTGVSHLIAKREGYVRGTLTWTAEHGQKSLLGQRALPDGALITSITAKPSAASTGSGLTLLDGAGNTWVSVASFTTAKKVLTLASQLPAGSASTNYEFNADPDTANYTGSIQFDIRYAVTEGTP